MIDHSKILELAKSGKYKSHEIAQIVGCGFTTVFKVCKENGVSLNNARKNVWEFNGIVTPELSYLLGMYLADGCLEHHPNKKLYTFMIRNTSIDIVRRVVACIGSIGGVPKLRTPIKTPSGKFSFAVCYYSTDFTNWVNNICKYKKRIPSILLTAGKLSKLAFISALIDGDGTVSKAGYITVKNTKHWIKQFPSFLRSVNIRTTGLKIVETLPNGKSYYSVGINRNDFSPTFLVHPNKRQRFLNPQKQINKKRKHKPTYFVCPDCNIKCKSRYAKRCRSCNNKHPKTMETLKRANRAANIARWGTAHLNRH